MFVLEIIKPNKVRLKVTKLCLENTKPSLTLNLLWNTYGISHLNWRKD